LYDRLTTVLEGMQKPYEIIFIDDASTDRSFDLLGEPCGDRYAVEGHTSATKFRPNGGAVRGVDEAQGGVIVSLDGDLQHEPEDIPALLAKIDEGFDIASGWRKNRLDNAVTRKFLRGSRTG